MSLPSQTAEPSKQLMSAEVALEQLLQAAVPLALIELLPTQHATGRILAQAVVSLIDVPPADNTQMDGYAINSDYCYTETTSAKITLKITQRIAAGHVGQPLLPGTAARIFTGALIPPGANAVVMQEQCTVIGDEVSLQHLPKAGEWVRPRGCDIQAGTQILSAGQRLRPQDVGLAASVGVASISVAQRLKVAMFFTGDELAMPGEPLKPGAIYNSNRFVLNGLLQQLGCEVHDLGNVPDTLDATRAALRAAAALADVVITSGGVSVGDEDHVKPAVEAEGSLNMWQLAIKPGKPLAFGKISGAATAESTQNTAHFFGLPGNPVSSFITFLLFVRPFLLRLQGVQLVQPVAVPVTAAFDWPRADARREYLRVRLNAAGQAELFANQNSAVLSSTVWGDGIVDNAPSQTIARGDTVRYIAFNQLL